MLAQPYNLFDLKDGESRDLVIARFAEEDIAIEVGQPPRRVVTNALRVWPTPEEPVLAPGYYDITSKTLIGYLKRYLINAPNLVHRFEVRAIGEGPSKRYQVSVR